MKDNIEISKSLAGETKSIEPGTKGAVLLGALLGTAVLGIVFSFAPSAPAKVTAAHVSLPNAPSICICKR